MRFVTAPFNDLDTATLQALLPLTNCATRGDTRDGSTRSGSSFRRYLQDRLRGFPLQDDSWAIVAYDNDVPAAWCVVAGLAEDPDSGDPVEVPTMSVGFYVARSHRRRGLGREVLQVARAFAREKGARQLVASPWNKASNAFFASMGFVEAKPFFTGWTCGVSVLDLGAP